MDAEPGRFAYRLWLAAAVVAVGACLLAAGLVSAHSRPVRFDPAASAILTAAPSQVTGWFTQPLRRDASWNFIHVINEQGARVDTGDISLSADRKQMSIALNSGLPTGRYLVNWRTWDDNDGAIFGDCYYFFVGQAAADAAVTANTRLDGGAACQRIDVSGREGTPVAGGTPQATAAAGATAAPGTSVDHDDEADEERPAGESSNDSDGIPVWGLVLGVIGGVVAGSVGGRLLGGRA